VVVDASVVVAGLFAEGTVRDVLLTTDAVTLCAPAYLREEVERHLPRVANRARIPVEMVRTIFEDILGCLELIPVGVYASSMSEARRLARLADAIGDEDYIALALALNAKIWTLDRDFRRVAGIRVLSTRQVENLPTR
jgi:predicted nucleic acid-binding protein